MTYSFSTAGWLMRTEEVGVLGWDLWAPAQDLDFSRPFMPEALARTAALGFLSPEDRLRLNQIRGAAHLAVLELLERLVGGSRRVAPSRSRELADRFSDAFVAGFGSPCEVAAPIYEPAEAGCGAASPLARALLGEHVVWMAKRHVQAAALNARTLEPGFAQLMLLTWVERAPSDGAGPSEALARQAARATATEIAAGVQDYRRLCGELGEALQAQARLDLEALERDRGRVFDPEAREQILMVQHHAYWWTYIGTGLTHPRFAAAVRRLAPGALCEFDRFAATFA